MMRSALIAAATAVAMAQTNNIVQLLAEDPEATTLVDLVTAAGLVPTLESTGPFTVFAPANRAFDALGTNILDFLANPFNVESLTNALTYHVAIGAYSEKNLTNGLSLSTADSDGEKLTVQVAAHIDIVGTITQATVVGREQVATNGIIHTVDAVLVPSNLGLPKLDIVQTAVSVADLSTLVTAVETANITEALSYPRGPYTVFAPTNEAFAALPAGVLNYLLAHPQELTEVLLYHVLDRRTYSTQIHNFERRRTLLGEDIVFVVNGGKVLVNGNATVLTADVQTSNGVVHVIDTVLIPNAVNARAQAAAGLAAPAAPNLVQLAQSVADLSTLVTAVTAGGLVSTLEGTGPFTVLAPTNEAFAALPADFLAYLLGNVTALDEVLTYHVIAGNVQSGDLKNGESVPTVEGANVTVRIRGNDVYFNDFARVVAANNEASNGVAHIIDAVLLPVA